MSIQIVNNGATIKVITNGVARYIVKSQIKFIDIVKNTIIKLDVGQGINNIYLNHQDVSDPQTASPEELRDNVNNMLASLTATGTATETKQDTEIGQLTSIKNDLDTIMAKISSLNDKAFYDPLLVDESSPNTIYKGYALAGSLPADPVWAIEKKTMTGDVTTTKWAGGNRSMDKIWNNKEALQYS